MLSGDVLFPNDPNANVFVVRKTLNMSDLKIERKCFCCEKDIEHAGPPDSEDTISNPPDNATYWQTPGNYGSTVFDCGEFTGERLEMYVCDECLLKKAHLVYHYRVGSQVVDVEDLKVFKPRG